MMLSALYLVTLIVDKDKVLDIFCILLQCKVYIHMHTSLSAYCSSGPGWCGLAPAVYNVLAPHEPGPSAGPALYWLLQPPRLVLTL